MRHFITSACLLITSCTLATAKVPPNDHEPDKSIVYKQPEGKELSLHVFLPDGWKASDKRPAAVFFFGGGWAGGTPRQFYPQCVTLAGKGMVAISAEYRTKGSHKTSPKQCVEDGKSAVRWLIEHADELGIDLDRFAFGGGSAGGHVAAAIHFCKGFDAENEDKSIPTTADALLLYNPVLDNGPGEYGHNKVKDYWKDFSPAHNVTKPAPPTLYMLGSRDNLISVETAKRFEKTVQEAGGRCDLKIYEGAGHGFFNQPKYLAKTNEELCDFLESLGWIEK